MSMNPKDYPHTVVATLNDKQLKYLKDVKYYSGETYSSTIRSLINIEIDLEKDLKEMESKKVK